MQEESDLQKIIVAKDEDILVILTARAIVDRLEEEIYFLKLGKQNASSVIYYSKSFEIGYPNREKLIDCTHFIIFTAERCIQLFFAPDVRRSDIIV